MNSIAAEQFDHALKILLVGDSGVGKSSLLMRFIDGDFSELQATIGVDFKAKIIDILDKSIKLTIWDTAGQERFRTLTSCEFFTLLMAEAYYRGAQGIIFVCDVTRRETFESLGDIWMHEVDMYSTVDQSVKMIIANKTDLEDQREVKKDEIIDFAKLHGCLYVETSAKGNIAVDQAFEELVMKILETPSLLQGAATGMGLKRPKASSHSSCC
eukprot:jgi/Picsp_1/6002/NSC_03356-R1_ras-related protein rab-18